MRKDNRGLTLIELIISIAILGCIGTVFVGFVATSGRMNAYTKQRTVASANAISRVARNSPTKVEEATLKIEFNETTLLTQGNLLTVKENDVSYQYFEPIKSIEVPDVPDEPETEVPGGTCECSCDWCISYNFVNSDMEFGEDIVIQLRQLLGSDLKGSDIKVTKTKDNENSYYARVKNGEEYYLYRIKKEQQENKVKEIKQIMDKNEICSRCGCYIQNPNQGSSCCADC